MERNEFEHWVIDAIERLPRNIRGKIKNVALCVEDWPSHDQFQKAGTRRGDTLLGLYEGIPETTWGKRSSARMPDKISIFREPILRIAQTPEELKMLIRNTVWHEIGHYFGFDEKGIRVLERNRSKRYATPV